MARCGWCQREGEETVPVVVEKGRKSTSKGRTVVRAPRIVNCCRTCKAKLEPPSA